jgi:hypothetical protein
MVISRSLGVSVAMLKPLYGLLRDLLLLAVAIGLAKVSRNANFVGFQLGFQLGFHLGYQLGFHLGFHLGDADDRPSNIAACIVRLIKKKKKKRWRACDV